MWSHEFVGVTAFVRTRVARSVALPGPPYPVPEFELGSMPYILIYILFELGSMPL